MNSAQRSEQSRKLNVRAEVERRSGWLAGIVREVGHLIASPVFLVSLVLFHLIWILLNSGIAPFKPWDPYPFTFLATLASAEAPILSVMILMRQNRESHINELREEINLRFGLQTERKVSTLLNLLIRLHQGNQLREDEVRDLRALQEPLAPEELLEEIRQELEKAEGRDKGQSV